MPDRETPDTPQQQSSGRAWLERSRMAWDARAARWDARAEANASAPDRAADLERVWRALDLHPGACLLDAGCGSGQYALAFAARGAVVTGVDLSPEMIRRARSHSAGRGCDVVWRVADIADLPDPDASYDAVFARMVLPFAPDPLAALRELRRVLKPDGRLLASVAGALSPIYLESWRRFLPEDEPGNTYLLPWELEQLLQREGWRIVTSWGEWGDDYHGFANRQRGAPGPDRALQQATATTWTTIARPLQSSAEADNRP